MKTILTIETEWTETEWIEKTVYGVELHSLSGKEKVVVQQSVEKITWHVLYHENYPVNSVSYLPTT